MSDPQATADLVLSAVTKLAQGLVHESDVTLTGAEAVALLQALNAMSPTFPPQRPLIQPVEPTERIPVLRWQLDLVWALATDAAEVLSVSDQEGIALRTVDYQLHGGE